MQQQVLIIGAGLSGLVLAQGLKKHNVGFSIFERDSNSGYRPQGYRVKLMENVFAGLRWCLNDELFAKIEESCAITVPGETLLNAIDGRIVSRRARLPGGIKATPYTVDRALLRSLLLEGLEDSIHFGCDFKHYVEEDGSITAHFTNGKSVAGSLIVGADGQDSKVRMQCLPQNLPFDSLCSCIYGKTPIGPELMSKLHPKIHEGFAWAIDSTPLVESIIFGDSPVGLLVEAMRWEAGKAKKYLCNDYLYWVLVFRNRSIAMTEQQLVDLFHTSAKELTLKMTEEWDPSLRCVLEFQDEQHSRCTKMISVNPELPAWETNARVTLVGDSVHVMTPTGGVGAVTAVRNAAILAQTIVERGTSVESIASYEESMRAFARVNLERSFFAGKQIINQPAFEECQPLNLRK